MEPAVVEAVIKHFHEGAANRERVPLDLFQKSSGG